MYKDIAYEFIVTVNVNDYYKENVGEVPAAYACITVYNGLIPSVRKELTIE